MVHCAPRQAPFHVGRRSRLTQEETHDPQRRNYRPHFDRADLPYHGGACLNRFQMGVLMDKQLKARWVEALRSGNYKQETGMLRNERTMKFCCLGVLADIQGAQWDFSSPRFDKTCAVHRDGGWLKEEFAGGLPLADQKTLSDMNDGRDRPRSSFGEIAEYIEKNL